jgi:protein-arginine kinase activator protein McsA
MIEQKTIVRCDRCPKKAELYPADVSAYYDRVMHRIRDYSKQNPNTGDDYVDYDLCEDCYRKFINFMNNQEDNN